MMKGVTTGKVRINSHQTTSGNTSPVFPGRVDRGRLDIVVQVLLRLLSGLFCVWERE